MQTTQFGGNWYGLQMESIEAVAREGLACILHMELEVKQSQRERLKVETLGKRGEALGQRGET